MPFVDLVQLLMSHTTQLRSTKPAVRYEDPEMRSIQDDLLAWSQIARDVQLRDQTPPRHRSSTSSTRPTRYTSPSPSARRSDSNKYWKTRSSSRRDFEDRTRSSGRRNYDYRTRSSGRRDYDNHARNSGHRSGSPPYRARSPSYDRPAYRSNSPSYDRPSSANKGYDSDTSQSTYKSTTSRASSQSTRSASSRGSMRSTQSKNSVSGRKMLQYQHRRQPSKHASQRIVSDSITATQNDTESVQGFVELTEETK